MKHISEIIEDILIEWAYRVHDGMPNPKNVQHIQQLRESMEELNLPNDVIYQVIQNLINEQDSNQGILNENAPIKPTGELDFEKIVGKVFEARPTTRKSRPLKVRRIEL